MVKRREVVRFFERAGFRNIGGTNHDIYVHADGRRVVIKRHTEIENAVFAKLIKTAGLKRDGRN